MLHLSISLLSNRVLVSIFVPEAVEGFQLGTLVIDLSFLEPFGLPEASIALWAPSRPSSRAQASANSSRWHGSDEHLRHRAASRGADVDH